MRVDGISYKDSWCKKIVKIKLDNCFIKRRLLVQIKRKHSIKLVLMNIPLSRIRIFLVANCHHSNSLNPFLANVPIVEPLKTSEHFSQGVRNENIGQKFDFENLFQSKKVIVSVNSTSYSGYIGHVAPEKK